MYAIAMTQAVFDMSWGAGLFLAVLVVCLTILSFRLIEVVVSAVQATLNWASRAWTWNVSAADEPARKGRKR